MVEKLYKSEDPNSAKKKNVTPVSFTSPSRDLSNKLAAIEPTEITKAAGGMQAHLDKEATDAADGM